MRREDETRRQFLGALDRASEATSLIEPTEEEKRNGWTAETLTEYVREQKASQELRADPASPMRRTPPKRANSKYRPHRWRG